MALEATTDLLVGQWSDSPRLQASINALLDTVNEDVLPGFDDLNDMRNIDRAEGVWLDYLGIRVGLRRSATTDPSADSRFGFDTVAQATGFDQAPFRGDSVNDAVYPLPDAIYRRFIKARATLVLGDGSFQTFLKALSFIDHSATAEDRRDMTVRIVADNQDILELADESGALPRTAGVRLSFVERGKFGFDDSGVSFDRGPFSGG